MNSNLFESAKAKIDRAKEILQQIEAEIQALKISDAHGIAFSHQSATDELVLTVQTPHHLFVRYAILAGEVIHQARSALDHAVWELLPSPRLGRSGFPVFKVEAKYDQRGVGMIDGINPAAASIIRGLQPFGSNFLTNPLFILNELWNRDKHRLLNTCMIFPMGISLLYHFPDGAWNNQMIQVPGGVVYGTELFRERHPGKDVEVMAEVAYTTLAFKDEPIARQRVQELLPNLVQFAENTIVALAETV